RAALPRVDDRAPHPRFAQDLRDKAGVATYQVEETTATRKLGELPGVGIRALQHGKLVQVQPKLLEPRRRVGHRLLRSLPRGRGRHHIRRALPGRAREHAVLLLVARLELVTSDERQQTGRYRHVRRIWRCPFASGSRPARRGSRTSVPPAPRSTTCSSRASRTERSSCASMTPTSSATVPNTRR